MYAKMVVTPLSQINIIGSSLFYGKYFKVLLSFCMIFDNGALIQIGESFFL